MSMHLKNSRDMMTTDDPGWWVSKTPLEQKLIILSSVLFILSFCLTISVIVLDNRKPPTCSCTVEPGTSTTISSSTSDSNATTPTTKATTVSSTTTTVSTVKPDEKNDKDKTGKEDDVKKGNADVNINPKVLRESSSPDVTTEDDKEVVKDTNAQAWPEGNATPETLRKSSPDEASSSRQL